MSDPYAIRPDLRSALAISGFSIRALERSSSVIYVLDRGFRIAYCNAAWNAFAEENDGAGWLRERVTGFSCMDAITPLLRAYYESAFAAAVRNQNLWEHDYECSSPDKSRVFRMRALPLHGERLLIENSLLVEGPHKAGASPEASRHIGDNGRVAMCGNCRRVLANGASGRSVWEWVPAYLVSTPVPVEYRFCDVCLPYYLNIDMPTAG